MDAEFLGLFFFDGGLDLILALFAEGELVDFFIDLGDWELDVLEWEWDAQTLEWASRF